MAAVIVRQLPPKFKAYQFSVNGDAIWCVSRAGDPDWNSTPQPGVNLDPLTQGWIKVPGADNPINSGDWIICDLADNFISKLTAAQYAEQYELA